MPRELTSFESVTASPTAEPLVQRTIRGSWTSNRRAERRSVTAMAIPLVVSGGRTRTGTPLCGAEGSRRWGTGARPPCLPGFTTPGGLGSKSSSNPVRARVLVLLGIQRLAGGGGVVTHKVAQKNPAFASNAKMISSSGQVMVRGVSLTKGGQKLADDHDSIIPRSNTVSHLKKVELN